MANKQADADLLLGTLLQTYSTEGVPRPQLIGTV
jgi:hypothetical protein